MLDFICIGMQSQSKDKQNLNSFLEREEDVETDVFSSEDFLCVDALSGSSMNETPPVNMRSEVILSHTIPMVYLPLPSKLKLSDVSHGSSTFALQQ